MKATRKTGKLVGVALAIVTIAVGSLALAKPTYAYWVGNTWCDTYWGYLHCIDP